MILRDPVKNQDGRLQGVRFLLLSLFSDLCQRMNEWMNAFLQQGVAAGLWHGPRVEGVKCYFELTARAGTSFREGGQAYTGWSHCQSRFIIQNLWNVLEHQKLSKHQLLKFSTLCLKLHGCHCVTFYLCWLCRVRSNACLFDKCKRTAACQDEKCMSEWVN